MGVTSNLISVSAVDPVIGQNVCILLMVQILIRLGKSIPPKYCRSVPGDTENYLL